MSAWQEEYDFRGARRAKDVPHLAKLQAAGRLLWELHAKDCMRADLTEVRASTAESKDRKP